MGGRNDIMELTEILKFENITFKHFKKVMANEMMSLT